MRLKKVTLATNQNVVLRKVAFAVKKEIDATAKLYAKTPKNKPAAA